MVCVSKFCFVDLLLTNRTNQTIGLEQEYGSAHSLQETDGPVEGAKRKSGEFSRETPYAWPGPKTAKLSNRTQHAQS
jgi:hypothetical protein